MTILIIIGLSISSLCLIITCIDIYKNLKIDVKVNDNSSDFNNQYKYYVEENKKLNKYGYATFNKFLDYYLERDWEIEKCDDLFHLISTDGWIEYYDSNVLDYPNIIITFLEYRMIMKSEQDYEKLIDFLSMKIEHIKPDIKEW